MTWDISYRSDVYEDKVFNEDGEMWYVEHEAFYVVATAPNGRRFAHFHKWTTEQMPKFNAENAVRIFMLKVEKAQSRGQWKGPNAHWIEIQPEYGSPAYTGEVAFEQDLMEARAFGEEAEFLDSCRRNGRVY